MEINKAIAKVSLSMTVFTLWAIANLGAQKLEFPKNIPRTPTKPQFNPPSKPTPRPPSNQRHHPFSSYPKWPPSNDNRPSIPTPQIPSNYPYPIYFPQNGMPGRTTSNNPNGISEYLYRALNNIPDKNGVTHVTFLSSQIQYRMYNWPSTGSSTRCMASEIGRPGYFACDGSQDRDVRYQPRPKGL